MSVSASCCGIGIPQVANPRRQIASMDQSFAPTPSDAVFHYHSIYDSQRWQERYADPGFNRHVSLYLPGTNSLFPTEWPTDCGCEASRADGSSVDGRDHPTT